jgi:serine protease Do
MVHRNFSCRQWPLAGATIASLLMLVSVAYAEPPKARDMPTVWLHRVADTGDRRGPAGFADLAEQIQPAVITVTSKSTAMRDRLPEQSFEFGRPGQEDTPDAPDGKPPKAPQAVSMGSGFFISADGYAVTSSHIVEDSDTAEIRTSDDKIYPAKVVGKDSVSGVALIKVEGRGDFAYANLADQPPRVGDWVLTAGNALGLGTAVTAGIVSARGREIEPGSAQAFIQIDAPLNQGDSGGPSFNTSGEVIGVNSFIFSQSGGSTGVAFAIPAETVKAVIPQLKDKGAVARGWMGAEVQSVTSEIADGLGMKSADGAIVASVQSNGPAAKAGLKSGDVITAVAGEPIRNANELTRRIQAMAPGSSVALATFRQGKEGSLNVSLGKLPEQSKSTVGWDDSCGPPAAAAEVRRPPAPHVSGWLHAMNAMLTAQK